MAFYAYSVEHCTFMSDLAMYVYVLMIDYTVYTYPVYDVRHSLKHLHISVGVMV